MNRSPMLERIEREERDGALVREALEAGAFMALLIIVLWGLEMIGYVVTP
jgi:hypothetical protein